MNILGDKPPYSRNEIKRLSSALRHGDEHDEEVFDRFMGHQADLIESLIPIIEENFLSNLLLERATDYAELVPDGGKYLFSSRPKTKGTTVEKLRRLNSYSLDSLHDTAGLRIDFDVLLSEQTSLVGQLVDMLRDHCALKINVNDLRTDPHSGYRAMHIICQFPAGKAEIQVRTSLQAMWANVFELAADIHGRDIRYEGWQEIVSNEVLTFVRFLHSHSDLIYLYEQNRDVLARNLAKAPIDHASFQSQELAVKSQGQALFEQLATIREQLEHQYLEGRSQQ